MAELLGLLASGISVVSLAIQVAESLKKLKDFCELINDAPEEILIAIDELETLSLVLEDVDHSMQEQLLLEPRVKAVVLRSYRSCRNSGEALESLAVDLGEGMTKGMKRGKLKAALKKDKMDLFRKRLESAKSTMHLANQVYYQAIQKQNWETHERDMMEIRSAISQ